jgi:glycosyltransferase involved in cell wall biosynthesis
MRILILARMTRHFHGHTYEEQPLGGSESALLYLTRQLKKFGHQIIIFNNCLDKAGNYDGVKYHNFTTLAELVKFSRTQNFDLFVSFRDLPAFLFPIKAKKRVCWLHDDFSNIWNHRFPVNILGFLFLRFAGFMARLFCDELWVVSGWLADICIKYLGYPQKRIWIIRNGINQEFFENKNIPRDPYRLVYTSVPDRGLDILLKIWPSIKAAVPQAHLHIYCGKDLGMLTDHDKKRAESLYQQINMEGVTLEGTFKHQDLALELLRSSLFLYPSHAVPAAAFYAETSCISALEAQAAGVPVISSRRGAMSETIINGGTGILIEGNPFSRSYQDKFVKETVRLLLDQNRLNQMRAEAIRHTHPYYYWATIAGEWDKKIRGMFS